MIIAGHRPAARSSLGWVGFAFAEENKDKVKELQVAKEANGTCVAPTAETITDGSYPLSRSLYIYVNTDKLATNPALASFRRLLPVRRGPSPRSSTTVPYVALPDSDLDATRQTWETTKAAF